MVSSGPDEPVLHCRSRDVQRGRVELEFGLDEAENISFFRDKAG
jgi:hypothetical protein